MNHIKQKIYNLLCRSEKYFKTDMVYLAKNSSWFIFSTVISLPISLATALAFANLIPKETYGTYQYVLSIADIFGIMVLGGIDTSIGRAVAQGKEGSIFDALRAKIKWGLLGGVGSILLGAYYILHSNMLLGSAFIITGIFIPFWEAPGVYVTYLSGKRRFDVTVICGFITQIITAFATILTLYFSKNLLVILTVYLGSYGIVRAFFFYFILKKFPPNNERAPDVITYGKHLTVMSAAGNISSSLDKVLLWHFLGPVALAVYFFSQTIPMKIAGVFKIVNRIAFPKMAIQDHATLQKTLPKKVFLLSALSTLSTLAYVVSAPFIFEIFFKQYLEAVPYTQVLALLIALQPFGLFSSALTAQAKQRTLYIYNFTIPFVRIALLGVLIPLFHLWGAVCALVLIKVADSVLLTALFYRK